MLLLSQELPFEFKTRMVFSYNQEYDTWIAEPDIEHLYAFGPYVVLKGK